MLEDLGPKEFQSVLHFKRDGGSNNSMVLLLRQFLAINEVSLNSASENNWFFSSFTEIKVLSSPSSLVKITVISMKQPVSSETTCQTQ